jgi:hypothetical protein
MHERGQRARRWKWGALACALALASAGCGLTKAPQPLPAATPAGPNLFANPGFELGVASWDPFQVPLTSGFTVSDAASHNPAGHSARVQIGPEAGDDGTHAAGFAQKLQTDSFPEFVSGSYRVDAWQPGDALQYVEFAVTVKGGDFDDGLDMHVTRFLIAGAAREPLGDPTTRYTFLSRAAPPLKRWTYFSYPVREAFLVKFGKAPTRWDALDIRFDVRYDDRAAGQPTPAADVSFDDLFAGKQQANPNRPPDP